MTIVILLINASFAKLYIDFIIITDSETDIALKLDITNGFFKN